MSKVITDLSGNPIPTRAEQSDIQRILSVPPIRDTPTETAVEFFFSMGAILPTATNNTLLLASQVMPNPFVPDRYRGRIDYFLAWCPDLILAAVPQVFWRLIFNAVPVAAWSRVPFHPRTGLASLTFPAVVDIPGGTTLTMTGDNLDAVNTHLIGIYVHGWMWPQDQGDR